MRSKAAVPVLLIHCLMFLLLFVGVCLVLVCYALISFLSSFAIILTRKQELVYFTLIVLLVSCDC